MNKSILIVGGCGFIGFNLAKAVKQLGFDVTILCKRQQDVPLKNINYLIGDISNRVNLLHLLANKKFRYVVNCGGYIDHSTYGKGGREIINAHFEGVLNLVDAIDKSCLQRFLQIGSSDEYGSSEAPQSEEVREIPISPYSLGKVAATHFLQMMWLSEKFPAVILRLFLVYGPGQAENRFIPQVIAGCLRGDTFAVSEGRQIRDFCYIDDIIFGIIEALTCKNVCGEVINLASGVPVSIRSVIEKISKLIGSGTPEYGKIPYRNSENMMLWADTSLAQELLNWSPSIKLEEGLPKVIEHYKKALGKR